MIGVLVILILSWGLLYLIRREDIRVIGLIPNKRSFRLSITAFFVSALLCIAFHFGEALLIGSKWIINSSYSIYSLGEYLYWDLKSVLFEELIFRGALLYLVIQYLGEKWSIAISSIAFGIYHWFSMGIFGNWLPMFFIFLGTGLMGWAWALSVIKSKSVWTAIAFHFGWNAFHNSIFSQGPLGKALLILPDRSLLPDLYSLAGLIGVPCFILLFVIKKMKREN